MNKFKIALVKTPILGRILLTVFRAKEAGRYFRKPVINLFKWLFNSRETTNFTYDLEENNKCYLASLIADVTNIEFNVIMAYIREVEEDKELRRHIIDATIRSDLSCMAEKKVQFGRRMGWYAFARALKPKVIVETGVDKGLGACVLAAALKRNKQEGCEGKYYGTDLNPRAGYLLQGVYANFGSILYGDSIASLKKLDTPIDLFINDSDHSIAYEASEYETVQNKLSENAIILGDNSHYTNKLLEFSLRTNRHFVFFQEKPLDHWFFGCGIGISFKR